MINDAITSLINGNNLSTETTIEVFNEIMEGKATDAQIGAYLVAQRMVGESESEITGAAQVMREKATHIPLKATNIVDTCGTGGDKSGSFNISTTCAFVVAGAGVPVAKHGNRSISSKCGSADVLMALGINLDLTPEQVGNCVDEINIGFLFAPKLHGAMKYAIGPRKEIGQRSIFNVLGPLTNPAGAKRQLMGVFDASLTETLARVLGNLGAEHVWLVAGEDGLDEITISGNTKISEFKDGTVKTFTIKPEDYGFESKGLETIKGDTAEENAGILKSILQGKTGPERDIVLLNAGATIYLGGKAKSFEEGIELAKESIDSGKALKALESLAEVSNAIPANS